LEAVSEAVIMTGRSKKTLRDLNQMLVDVVSIGGGSDQTDGIDAWVPQLFPILGFL